jgi:dienelactone hydrolase
MPAKSPGETWMQALFGSAVASHPPLAYQLVHELPYQGGRLSQWQISAGDPVWLRWFLHVLSPARSEERILLSPDGCWPQCVNPEAMQQCIAQGVSLAWFDRLAFAHDPPSALRQGAFYEHFPQSASGCLSVWAWGLSLNAQVLREQMPDAKIGVIGHSRGGKAALLCGALDHRIDAVIANNSGTGGAASLAVSGAGAESLAQLASGFPHWLGLEAADPAIQTQLSEVDCMALWSRIAPRPVLILQAQQDAWANPLGTRHAYTHLKPHWSEGDALRLVEREGAHAMQTADWREAAMFMQQPHAGWF